MTVALGPLVDQIEAGLPGLAAIYCFGSAAEGRGRADSDIDFAVYSASSLARDRLEALRQALSLAARRDVDLIDLSRATTVLQMEVLRAGPALRVLDPTAAGFFETRIMRDYQDLKRARAGIEADIAKRGAVYGR